ncbi:MAG: serine/threonine protein kinase [Calothrix sp. FI2-JRJ7]|jgi:serine/threonine protein kinase|nr:serine/threonine protein kinase [Calothrix sp. FI2-JRJ7]
MADQLLTDANQKLHDRYIVIRKIAENGNRRTLLALDSHHGNEVVIKILLFNEEFRWEDLKLFEREAETLKHLSHPAIPQYLDYFELDTPEIKGFALVQTYCNAKSLQEYIDTGRNFSESEIIQLGKLLLGILHYLHSRHPAVIHRDIKPSNILLNNTSGNSVGDVYLVDFGSVQTSIKARGTRTVVGTYGYMPPEQFGGRAFPGSDLYSLGMTLIYLATKKHPSELLGDDLNIKFEQIPNISADLKAWLNIIIQPSVNRRFDSTTAALHALDNLSNLLSNDEYNLYYRDNDLSKLKKPAHSKIKIKKTVNKLEMIFPTKTIKQIVGNIFNAIIPSSIILFIGYHFLFYPIIHIIGSLLKIFIINYIVIFLCISLALFIISCLLINLFGRTKLLIEEKRLIITTEVFGSQTLTGAPRRIIAREHIWKLVSSAQEYKLINLKNDIEKIVKSPSLIIWEGTFSNHDLSQYLNQPLTLQERDWLAQEISDFLDIQIIQE